MNSERAVRCQLRICLLTFFAALCATPVAAQGTPGATITNVNEKTAVVSAKVNSTGQEFTFTLANKSLISRLHAGQGVYVNLGNKQVSLDGKSPSGSILAILPLIKKPGASISPSGGSSGSSGSGSTTSSGNTNAQPVSFSCGGTTNPLTSDTCGKTGAAATRCCTLTCGSSVTMTGNIYPAGSSDWLSFQVPTSLANCPTPELGLQISSGGSVPFDLVKDAMGTPYQDGANGNPTLNVWAAVLGNSNNPVAGIYYIRVHGYSASSVHTWTLTIKGVNIPQPVSVSCGGTANPLSADTCSKYAGSATNFGTVTCGASEAITGNTFPAGSSDWLTFSVPTSLASCPTPELLLQIMSSASATAASFDLVHDAAGTAFLDGNTGGPILNAFSAVLGNQYNAVAAGPGASYYIRVHGYSASSVGTWTLTIKGVKTPD